MRDIKFRGKRADNGEWVYGYLVVKAGMPFIFSFGVIEPILVVPETIGQYIGLKDKNSVEIYEGNLLFDEFNNEIGYIVWNEDNVRYEICFYDYQDSNSYEHLDKNYTNSLTVVGNLHDKEKINGKHN